VGEGGVDPQLAAGTTESVGQRLSGRRRFGIAAAGRRRRQRRLRLLLFALGRAGGSAAGPARVARPDARSYLHTHLLLLPIIIMDFIIIFVYFMGFKTKEKK